MFHFIFIFAVLEATVDARPSCMTASVGEYKNFKELDWQLVKNCTEDSHYSVRFYPASYWVTVSADGYSAESMLFMTLFYYIKENNIDMTVPVRETYIIDYEGKMEMKTMSFYIAGEPIPPLNPKLKIEKLPPMTVFVREFGGYAFDGNKQSEMDNLKDDLSMNSDDFDERMAFFAGYDDPMTWRERRNEIWLLQTEK